MFTSTVNQGFHMKFDNGITISVQWGYGNYCAIRDLNKEYTDTMKNHLHSSQTAEVCIWDENGDDVTAEYGKHRHDGHVMGWLSSDDVAEMMVWAKNYNKIKMV